MHSNKPTDIQLSECYAKNPIKHQFLDNLTDVKQKNKLESHEWHCEGFGWQSGIIAALLSAVFVFMSHAALCQLWLCNMDTHVIGFSFWRMLLQQIHGLFSLGGCQNCTWVNFLALYCVCVAAATLWNCTCFVIFSLVVINTFNGFVCCICTVSCFYSDVWCST